MNTTPPHAIAGGTSEDAAHRDPSAVVEPASEPVHPDADRFFQKLPWSRNIPIFGEACQAYGPRCTLSLALCYLLSKGIADMIIAYARYPMFRGRFGINAQRYQRLANISMMGWSIKAFTAMLCDAFAFMGYTKRWYMMILCFLGAAFALGYGLLPAKQSSADIAAGFVFMTSFSKASVDILSQGHYSRLMRRTPKAGPAMVSWIWIFIMTGAIIASGIQGPLSDANLMHVGVFISAALQFLTGFIFVFNWYGERRNRTERAADARYIHEESLQEQKRLAAVPDAVPQKDLHPEEHSLEDPQAVLSNVLSDDMQVAPINDLDYEIPEPIPCCCGLFEFNKEVTFRNWRIFVFSVVMTCTVITMTCGNILADKLGLLIISICVSVVSCGTSLWALPPVIAKANVFGYLQTGLYLQLPGAVDSFYLATPDCNPGGPNFSYTFYNTVGAVIGNIAGMIGVVCFNYIFSKRSYRLTFVITTVIQIIASVFDIIMVNGWNKAIGIPYHAMYICGDAIFFQVCYMLAWMPSTILISRLCPRGSESLVYALMAGFSNLGQSTSSAFGAILMEYVWPVNTDVIPCDFSNVKWLLLVGHILLPLLIIPLSILLIPAARICDDIDVDGNVIQKAVRSQQMQAETDSTPDKK